jgi:hypothetical protein
MSNSLDSLEEVLLYNFKTSTNNSLLFTPWNNKGEC